MTTQPAPCAWHMTEAERARKPGNGGRRQVSGDVHRLKSWTRYGIKKARTEPGLLSEGFKTQPGFHTVVIILGGIDEKEAISDEWLDSHLAGIGLQRRSLSE
jgi:hypothetical protein